MSPLVATVISVPATLGYHSSLKCGFSLLCCMFTLLANSAFQALGHLDNKNLLDSSYMKEMLLLEISPPSCRWSASVRCDLLFNLSP